MDNLKKLKRDVGKKNVDRWDEGTVIKWKSCDKFQYAVIKAAGAWWITGKYNYYQVRTFSYDELVDVLARSDVGDIQVSDTWKKLEDA